MRAALYGFGSIVFKELLHIRRDPTTLIFALLVPMLQLILFGYAIDFDVRHIRTIVLDMDRSRESRDYIQSVINTQYLDVVAYATSPDQAAEAVRRNDERVALIIPPDFARRYGTDRPPTVQVLVDGSDSMVARPAEEAISRPAPPDSQSVEPRVNVLYNPQMRTQIYTIPGLVCVLLQLITVSLTSFSLVREREQGSLEQLMVSPVGRLGLILGKLVPYSVLAMFELVGILFLGRLIFDVHIAGSFLLLVALAVPFILAALSMGLFISTIAQNQAQAMQMTMLTTLPSILLSGYIAPRETLPAPLYLLSEIIPVTHFIQISRGIVVRGAGLMDLLPSVGWLLLLTVLLLAGATARFRKSIA
ncbi:MAG TPA: ABC transporter permease [Chthonomonadaceae bacterium]|nr:ABC transporter permease [Chthonomonadaceae bacterium]